MYREVFERRTVHQDFLRLRNTAEQAVHWKDLRDWALDFMRDRARAGNLRQEMGHAADVLGPLARLIERGVEQASDKYRYPKAIRALKRLRDDYERAGDATGFGAELVHRNRRRRLADCSGGGPLTAAR